MGAIILTILSVIGKILLGILLAILALILLVLFFPISYRVEGSKNTETTKIHVKVSWLFGLIRFLFRYPDPGKPQAFVLFFDLLNRKPKAKKRPKKNSKKDPIPQPEIITEESAPEPTPAAENDVPTIQQDEVPETSPEEEEPTEEKKKESLSEKITKLKEKIRSTIDKIKDLKDNIEYYKGIWEDESTKRLIKKVLDKLIRILKHIRPRKCKADLCIGTGSPDTTGYLYGIYGVFLPVLGKQVLITPDFTQSILEGTFEIKGHITVIVFVIIGLKLLFDKDLRKLIKKLKKRRA